MAITINGTGSITGLTAGGLPDGSVTAADIETSLDLTGKTVTLPSGTGGKILQVVSSTKTAAQSYGTTYTDITDLSVDITMSDASNHILVMICINNLGGSDANGSYVKLLRGTTVVTSSTAGGGSDTDDACLTGGAQQFNATNRQMHSATLIHRETPGTGTHTYKVQCRATGGTRWINRWALNADQGSVSSITVMEVSA
jgi:hypothetical protein